MKCCKLFSGIFILVILFGGACGTATIKTETIPELKVGSPLSGIKPVTFFVKKFRDEAGDVVCMSPVGAVKIDKPANQLFSQAIVAELKRNGHTVLLNDNDGKADVVIDGTVKKYWIEFRPPGIITSAKYIGHAEAEITITKTSDAIENISKLYSGSYECGLLPNPHVAENGWRNCLYETLSNMVNDFSTDPDLFALLKRLEEIKHVPH
jgi:hypothetical protein